ncbi:MAG: aminopeptidase [Burkholderiales bacterium]
MGFKYFGAMVLLAPLLGGCANLGFYWQSVGGQIDIWKREQPIETLLSDQTTPPDLKRRLESALRMREFASRELDLPDNGSFRKYADLKRPYVLWNVFAAPEFSVKPREWCFVFAGCVSYRGYFSESEAERISEDQRSQGYDVFVAGVPAYSTLGWFDDPILNTFIYDPESEVAGLIFHELAHQVLYVKDDTTFNESFAVTVQREGVSRWLAKYGTSEQRATFVIAQRRKQDFTLLVMKYRSRLDELYSSAISDSQKRKSKRQIFSDLQQEYTQLKASWGGFSGYDHWLPPETNNASLASVATYTQLVPAFQALLAKNDGNLTRFYQAVKEIAGLPKPERDARLAH